MKSSEKVPHISNFSTPVKAFNPKTELKVLLRPGVNSRTAAASDGVSLPLPFKS